MPFDPTDAALLAAVTAYVTADGSSPDEADVLSALKAEIDAQAARIKIPEEPPADLTEALCRRVAHNLALRKLPLGIQPLITEAAATGVNVAGTDAEVKRLEAPHRKRVVG